VLHTVASAHTRSLVVVGCAVRYCEPLHALIVLHERSLVAVFPTDSNCVAKSHTLSIAQLRLLVVVGATDSNCQS